MAGRRHPRKKERFSYGCSTAKTISSGNGSWAANDRPTGNSMHSSSALPICRVDWRPSRLLAVATGLLGILASWSLWLSALPVWVTSILAVAIVMYSVVSIRRELRRESFTLTWAGGDEAAVLNFASGAQSLSGPRLSIRGPLAAIRGKDGAGCVRTWLWWPDTLSSAARRQLRLADQIKKEQSSTSKTA